MTTDHWAQETVLSPGSSTPRQKPEDGRQRLRAQQHLRRTALTLAQERTGVPAGYATISAVTAGIRRNLTLNNTRRPPLGSRRSLPRQGVRPPPVAIPGGRTHPVATHFRSLTGAEKQRQLSRSGQRDAQRVPRSIPARAGVNVARTSRRSAMRSSRSSSAPGRWPALCAMDQPRDGSRRSWSDGSSRRNSSIRAGVPRPLKEIRQHPQ